MILILRFIEWCTSPIVYTENDLAAPLRKLADSFFLPKKAMYHYISMARHNYNTYLTGDEVKIKKYFYALRPVLAAKWIADYDSVPPMLFDDLVKAGLQDDLAPVVADLLRVKKETSELGTGPKIPELDRYIQEQMEILQAAADKMENRRNDWDVLEEFFRAAVM